MIGRWSCSRIVVGLVFMLGIPTTGLAQTRRSKATLPGHYYLQGRREVGSELLLEEGGRFKFALTYGAVDEFAKGRWSVSGNQLVLTADQEEPRFSLGPSHEELDAKFQNLDTDILACVKVETPSIGYVWSNIELTAEFSNGLTRRGLTGSNGMLGFAKRTEAEWAGATLKLVAVAYPKGEVPATWFDWNPRTRTQIILFNPGRLVECAFETMKLQIQKGKKGITLRDERLGTYARE